MGDIPPREQIQAAITDLEEEISMALEDLAAERADLRLMESNIEESEAEVAYLYEQLEILVAEREE